MVYIIGRVTKDLEPLATPNGTPYVHFDVAENLGYGEKAATNYHQCSVFGADDVARIVNAGVKKGSLLNVVGDQKLGAYTRDADGKAVPTSNVDVWHWNYINIGSKKSENKEDANSDGTAGSVITEDCDDGLPV